MNLTLHSLKISDEQFEQVVKNNPEYSFEQTAYGELVVVPPTGGTSGRKNFNLIGQFSAWVERNLELGEGFDSSTLFKLPNSAKRSPDASWIKRDRWEKLTQKQQDGYVPLCPDLVIELRSPTDSLEELRAKMHEYMDNGAQLGWLIDPQNHQVYIFRQNVAVEIIDSPNMLFGSGLTPGFVLNLTRIWA